MLYFCTPYSLWWKTAQLIRHRIHFTWTCMRWVYEVKLENRIPISWNTSHRFHFMSSYYVAKYVSIYRMDRPRHKLINKGLTYYSTSQCLPIYLLIWNRISLVFVLPSIGPAAGHRSRLMMIRPSSGSSCILMGKMHLTGCHYLNMNLSGHHQDTRTHPRIAYDDDIS